MLTTFKFCVMTSVAFFMTVSGATIAGDGKPDGKKSLGGSGEMIQFEIPDGSRMLAGIEVHGSRYGTATPPDEKFLIYVLNESMTKVVATEMAPYSLFERGDERWVKIKFDEPVEFPDGGWIVLNFRAGRTKGVYVSYDADSEARRSKIGLPGMEARETGFDGDWMIRPIVAP
jgi:hypothetical protein